MKKLILSLLKKKLFKNGSGGLRIPKSQPQHARAQHVNNSLVVHKGQGYKQMHQRLQNLSIKPLKFRF
jgi:hypothetical protein